MRQKERIRNFVENALSESMDVQEQSMVLLGGDGDMEIVRRKSMATTRIYVIIRIRWHVGKMQASVQIAEYARTLLI